jgi:hypothetical protein
MDIDFNSVDTSGGSSLYEPGAYRVRIKSIEEVTAQSGNLQLKIQTIFVGGSYDDKKLTDYITLVKACDWKLAKFIECCGVDLTTLGKMDTNSGAFRATLNKLINKTTIWVVEQKTSRSGELISVVTDYQPDPDADSDDAPDFIKEEGKEIAWDEDKKSDA